MSDIELDDAGIQAMIHREARCLDRNDYEAWMNLFTEDGDYFVPLDPTQDDPSRFDAIIYENRALMMIRAENFAHPESPSQEQTVRSARVISGIMVLDLTPAKAVVESSFICSMLYKTTVHYTGRYEHHIVRSDRGLRIQRKRVNLINADQPFGPIMTYI